jgi:hypothetical protein
MLPDIRVVVTAIATTVLILVGIGLMASIRITHQTLSAGSVVTSSHADGTFTNPAIWRQLADPVAPDATLAGHAPWVPERVLSLPHETVDATALAAEEKTLAERILTGGPRPRYAGASLDPSENPELAARVAEERALAHPALAAEPITTATVSPPTKNPALTPTKAAKAGAAKARATQLQPAKPKRAIRRTARALTPNHPDTPLPADQNH